MKTWKSYTFRFFLDTILDVVQVDSGKYSCLNGTLFWSHGVFSFNKNKQKLEWFEEQKTHGNGEGCVLRNQFIVEEAFIWR